MSNSKPVSYLTLKCLLKHLDPNLRLQLSLACPSIQTLEKSIPLHIKSLLLTDRRIDINRSTYQFTVINRQGSYDYDINQYGRIDLGKVEQNPNELRFDERIDHTLIDISRKEALIPILKQQLSDPDVNRERTMEDLESTQRSYKRLLEEVESWKLYPNVSGENFIKLKVGGRVEVLNYQRKMHEAIKYFLGKLFDGRTVNVIRFTISCRTILRIPSTLKFRITHLELPYHYASSCLKIVGSLIEDSSLPLCSIKSRFNNISSVNDNSIVKTAKLLKLDTVTKTLRGTLRGLKHKRVHINNMYNWQSIHLLEIVDYWMIRGKEIGTYHTYALREKLVDEVMENVLTKYKDRIEAGLTQNTCKITLNRSDTSNFVIRNFQQGKRWVLGLKMELRKIF